MIEWIYVRLAKCNDHNESEIAIQDSIGDK